ncbi:hypothetical protein ACMFMG_008323 [Clarireedia jacksonii]
MISTSISYDKAGVTPLVVGSNKSIVGVGNGDVITGKGLHLPNTSKNVIIQKVHITNINSGSVWGGGGLMLDGNADVWIDHCKFSKVGRMFIVYDFNANTVAISNTKFDSVITTSATYSKTHTVRLSPSHIIKHGKHSRIHFFSIPSQANQLTRGRHVYRQQRQS